MNQENLSLQYQLIEKAIRILAQQTQDAEPQLAVLAAQLHTTTTHLQKVFTQWAGISPKQFFHCLQKDHALKLIRAGQSTLSVSLEMGFQSTSKLHNLMLKFEALSPGEIKTMGAGQQFIVGQTPSPFGNVYVCLTPKGLNSLEFETDNLSFNTWRDNIQSLYPMAQLTESNEQIKSLIQQVFPSTSQEKMPMSVVLRGTPFQLKVWEALIHLPPAQLASYQQVAHTIGQPTASRAVGSAIAKNPIAYLIPCHRVIQSTGELGQYRWQHERKKALHIWEQGLLNSTHK